MPIYPLKSHRTGKYVCANRETQNAWKKVLSIEKRTEVVDLRKRIWDWQADTMISEQVHAVLMTLIERKARFIVAIEATNKTAKAVTNATY